MMSVGSHVELLRSLKESAGRKPELCLTVGTPVESRLRCVATAPDRLDEEDVRCLTEWRNQHVGSFLTEFEATLDRTRNWLVEHVRAHDGKILFMVEDAGGRTIGYMGISFIDWQARTAEADSVVRGLEAPRGLMGRALLHLLAWARAQLLIEEFHVRVRSDNPAVGFYEKIGFVEFRREPHVREVSGEEIHWRPAKAGESGGMDLVHMRLSRA